MAGDKMISKAVGQADASCGVLLICVMMAMVLSAAEGFLTRKELSPWALFSVPQGEGKISKGGATGTGQLRGRGVLGSPGTRYPRANVEAVGCAGGGTGGILVSAWQRCWGGGRLVAWRGGGTAAGLAPTGHVNPLPSLPSEVLTRRASLLAEAAVLQQQNSELCLLLEEYVSSGVSATSCPPCGLGTPHHRVSPTQGSRTRGPLPAARCCRVQGVSPRR